MSGINCLFQNGDGFLWLGTSRGLMRYDGYNFKEYTNDPHAPMSLSNNSVLAIGEDLEGNMWVGTEKGLNKFNKKTGDFSRYLIDHEISAICEDKEGILWIGTYGCGLIKMTAGGQFFYYKKETAAVPVGMVGMVGMGVSHNNIRAICEDEQGILWIGTDGGGLNRFDKKTERFLYFKHNPRNPNSLNDNHVIAIYGEKNGPLWIGSYDGLDKLDRGKEGFTFTHYKHDSNNPYSLSHDRVTSIYKDSAGIMWIGTRGGLNRLEKGNFYHYQYIRNNPYTLSGDMINTIYEDKSGILWIGTLGEGLNKYNRRTSIFESYYSDPGVSGSLKHDVIFSLYEDRSGRIWVGTFGEGLAEFDRQRGYFTQHKYKCPGNEGVKCNIILAIYEDSQGKLWLGTDGGGLGQFERQTGELSYLKHDENNPTSLSNNTILALYEDVAGVLWVGTEKGLNKFDRNRNNGFIQYYANPGDNKTLSGDYIMTILEEPAEHDMPLWIGVYNGGLNKFDREKGVFTAYRSDANNPNSLSNDNVRCIFRDSHGTLWIGTDNGLNKFDRETSKFSSYLVKDGLPGDTVYGILEDHTGHLWMSTNNGLSRFDPVTHEFKNYDTRDGIQQNKFNNGSFMKSRNGEMYFGGISGFNLFDPAKLEDNPHIPPIVITGFKMLFNDSALKSPSPGVLENKIFKDQDEIVLYYDDYYLSIEFSALDFTVQGKNRYKYKLEGVDRDWIEVDAGKRVASYMNLSPGTYIFRVLGSNNDGIWNMKGTSLKITVLPPFWREWWFFIFTAFLLLLSIFSAFQWRTRRLRKSRDEMEHARNLAEFRNAENEKLINSISSIFIAVKANGSISQWNRPAEKFFAVPGNEAKKFAFVELLKKYMSMDKINEIIRLGLLSDKPANNIEIEVQPGNGNESRLLLTNINPIMDRSGKTFGFLLLAEDITNRKKEQILRDISQKLEALGQMAAGIAHEIRSPLQFIGDNGQFLLEAFSNLIRYSRELRDFTKNVFSKEGQMLNQDTSMTIPDDSDFDFYCNEIPKASEQIVAGVARVSDIVKSMNEFAYTGDGINERGNINELLKTTLVVAHNRLNKVAQVETKYAPDIKPIRCGSGELNQVFLNILLNAADAIADTGKRGLIKIITRQEEDEVIVEIHDNGTGIPDNIKDKIFMPFFTTKEVGKGTGQGLHFSYRIVVERHRGKLYFKSSEGHGACFYIHLPVDAEY
ncbi:MAG: ATP-binding protein [Acidobacteria bacterium]|nr:ATP-binding protein [Acidobacteriota bacterium]